MSGRLDKRLRKANLHTMERHVLACVDDDWGGKRTAKALRNAIKGHGLGATVERVVTEHLRDGQVVEELVFHRNALGASGCAGEADRADR